MRTGKVLYMHHYKKQQLPRELAWPVFLIALTVAMLMYIAGRF